MSSVLLRAYESPSAAALAPPLGSGNRQPILLRACTEAGETAMDSYIRELRRGVEMRGLVLATPENFAEAA